MLHIPIHVIAFFLAIMMLPEDVNQFTIAVQGKEIQWTIVLSQAKGGLFEKPATITWKKSTDGVMADEPGGTVTHKVSKVATQFGELTQTAYYRGDSMVLKKVTPPDESQSTVYYVIHNGFEVLTYKTGPAGTEFAEAGIIRDMVKPDYTIKMAGDKEGRIQRITLYSPDFSKTYEGYWLRNNELIPWTAEELAGWRKMRDPGARKEEAGDP